MEDQCSNRENTNNTFYWQEGVMMESRYQKDGEVGRNQTVGDSSGHVKDFSLYPVGHEKPLEDFNHRGDKFSSAFFNDPFGDCLKNDGQEGKGGIRMTS